MIVGENETGGAGFENPLQQGPVAAADRAGVALDAAHQGQQQPIRIEQNLDHDFATEAADVFYERFEKRSRGRPDDAGARDQFCHDGSFPYRLDLIMCSAVPSISAARTMKVGVPRISA